VGDTCAKCGKLHERCSSHNGRGEPCGVRPMVGLTVCGSHGGRAPAAKAKSQRAKQEVKVAKQLQRIDALGQRREGLSPTQLMQEVVERAGADLEYVADQVSSEPEVWAQAYAEILDRAAKVAKAGVDAGLAERQTAVQEAQAARIGEALTLALADLGLTTDVQRAARVALATRLRELEAG
jgi:hypothetical protein